MTYARRVSRIAIWTIAIVAIVSAAYQANAQTSSGTSTQTVTTTTVNSTAVYAPSVTSGTMANGGIPNFLSFSDLSVGSVGPQVYDLQSALAEQGFFTFGLPTGYFGGVTKAAVTAFQRSYSVPTTGYFGPMSRSALASVISTVAARLALSTNTSSNLAYTSTYPVAAPTMSPLHATGYWYNGNWYSTVPAPGTPDVVGYWINGTWTAMPNVSSSVAQNTASGSMQTQTTTSANSTYGISTSHVNMY